MSFIYNEAKRRLGVGQLDFVADDIQVLLIMANTTAGPTGVNNGGTNSEDVTTIDGFTTLDEYDGSGYSRQLIDTQTLTTDTTNDRAEFDSSNNVTFQSLGTGARGATGAIIFNNIGSGNDNLNYPIAYIDEGGFPFSNNGGTITLAWDSEGIIHIL